MILCCRRRGTGIICKDDGCKCVILIFRCATTGIRSTGGLVGYDDWFTPSRSGVRFPPGVRYSIFKDSHDSLCGLFLLLPLRRNAFIPDSFS
jgi:hypothetical protein